MSADVDRLISLAITAAGPIGPGLRDWEARVEAAVPVVASILSEKSLAHKRAVAVQDAQYYTGLFVSLEKEHTNRWILTTEKERSATGEPEYETIRTDFENTLMGKRVIGTLGGCKPGDRISCMRVNEPMRDNPKKNVRVLYHVKVLQRAQEPGAQRAQPDTGRAETHPSAPASRSDPPEREAAPQAKLIEDFPRYSNKQKIAIAQQCRLEGIENFLQPEPEELDTVLRIITEELMR